MSRRNSFIQDRHPTGSGSYNEPSGGQSSIIRDGRSARPAYYPPSSFKPPLSKAALRYTPTSSAPLHERSSSLGGGDRRRDSLDAYRAPMIRDSSVRGRSPSIAREGGRSESRYQRDTIRPGKARDSSIASRTAKPAGSSGLLSTSINTAGVGLRVAASAVPNSPYAVGLNVAGVGAVWASKGMEKVEKHPKYPEWKEKAKSFFGIGGGSDKKGKGPARNDDEDRGRRRRR